MTEFDSFNFHGGAVLADNTCGSVSFRDCAGGDLSFNLTDDPEYTMSGLYEPDASFERW